MELALTGVVMLPHSMDLAQRQDVCHVDVPAECTCAVDSTCNMPEGWTFVLAAVCIIMIVATYTALSCWLQEV